MTSSCQAAGSFCFVFTNCGISAVLIYKYHLTLTFLFSHSFNCLTQFHRHLHSSPPHPTRTPALRFTQSHGTPHWSPPHPTRTLALGFTQSHRPPHSSPPHPTRSLALRFTQSHGPSHSSPPHPTGIQLSGSSSFKNVFL